MSIWPLADRFPDATLALRSHAAGAEPDLSHYTPEFAAQVRRMRADFARLSAMSAPIGRTAHHAAKVTGPDYSRYTPEFAAEMRAMARSVAGHTTAVSLNGAARPPRVGEMAAAAGHSPHRGVFPVQLTDRR
jgi:hypothetical protein